MQFYTEIQTELQNILNYWMQHTIDTENGGFIGQLNNNNQPEPNAGKGAILNARILWTFAAAYNQNPKPEYLQTAQRAYQYITQYFIDPVYGGVFWELDPQGNVTNDRKQFYALSFTIYALAEYYRATKDSAVLNHAITLYNTIEEHSFDTKKNGYIEALARDWSPLADFRLSTKDDNAEKTMNTHLHILEAYTNLYREWKDEKLAERLQNLIEIFRDKIIQSDFHFGLFFDMDWKMASKKISYGHDIEGSWLLHEAAEVLGNKTLLHEVEQIALKMAEVMAAEGIDTNSAVIDEYDVDANHRGTERHWWPQAEGMVGFYNAYQLSGKERFLNIAQNIWKYTQQNLLDTQNGEWFWCVDEAGKPSSTEYKVGFWKCPYHNGRACIELLTRIQQAESKLANA